MTADLVIDCSLAVAWCFADESTAATSAVQDRLIEATAVVPAVWHFEVANVLAMAERRGRISAADANQFLAWLEALDIRWDQTPARINTHVLPLARKHRLTVYDAAYLELAIRL